MENGLRSLVYLAAGFVAVAIVVTATALVILPPRWGDSPETGTVDSGSVSAPIDDTPHLPEAVGGSLSVSGARTGVFPLTTEVLGDTRYGLRGDRGGLYIGGDPPAVVQLSFEGMEFFPDQTACDLEPGQVNPAIGVVSTRVECRELEDIRGNGFIEVGGTIGLPADLLGAEGDLPAPGGELEVGGETIIVSEARLMVDPRPAVAGPTEYRMHLANDSRTTILSFTYDLDTGVLALAQVVHEGSVAEVSSDACSISLRILGVSSPRRAMLDMSLDCKPIEVGEERLVPIKGSVIVEQVS